MGVSSDEEIYRKYADELVRFATGLVGPIDAQDVVSETCLRAFHAPKWPTVENHRAYLYRTMLNEVRRQHRSTLRRRLREVKASGPTTQDLNEADLDVLDAVDRLSVRQRAVVILTYWEDLSNKDAAARLGISPGAVKRHLSRARARIREQLHD